MADYLGYHWYFTHLTGLAMRDPTLALASGNNDLYTAPAGKRALVRSGVAYNSSGGAISFYHLLKSGGNYYQLSAPFSLAAATQTSWAGNAVAQGVGIVL